MIIFFATRLALSHLLDSYENASSQRLTKDKTSMFFNNIEETKRIITSIVGIRSIEFCEKYLGLPYLVGISI